MVAKLSIEDEIATVTLSTGRPMNALTLSGFGRLRDILVDLRGRDDYRSMARKLEPESD